MLLMVYQTEEPFMKIFHERSSGVWTYDHGRIRY